MTAMCLLVQDSNAQFFDDQSSVISVQQGWVPSVYNESIAMQQASLVAGAENLTLADSLGAASGLDNVSYGYAGAGDGLLTPMIPGEAISPRDTLARGIGQTDVRLGLPLGFSSAKRRVTWQTGPLGLDLESLGLIALTSSLSGPLSDHLPDDGLIGALVLNSTLLLQLTERGYLYIHSSLYYLFTKNKLGFYFGNGDVTSARFSYAMSLGGWEIRLEDRFSLFNPLRNALDEAQVDEIAVAGRYRLGRPDLVRNHPFGEEDLYFLNLARLTASRWIADDWKLKLYADHWDAWRTNSFERVAQVNRLGGALFYDSPDLWFMPWAMYDWYDINHSQWTVQHAVMGATLPFSRRFQAYLKATWTNVEAATGRDVQRPGWEAGFIHRITESCSQSLFFGNDFFMSDVGEPFLGTYWRYTLRYARPGARSSASVFVQESSNDLSSWDSRWVGAKLETRLTPCTRASIAGAVTDSSLGAAQTTTKIVRLSLAQQLSRALTSTLTWQITDQNSNLNRNDFTEQLVMLSLQWNL